MKPSECGSASISQGSDPTYADGQLIELYRKSGEVQHLNVLFSRHLVRIRMLMYQMVLNAHDADDITQEVFIRVARAMDRFKAESRFTSWLYRIAMNCAKSFLVHKKNRREQFGTEACREPSCQPSDHPDRVCVRTEIEGSVHSALQVLSPKLRAAIVLTTFHNMTVTDAARVEVCPVPTMYWRIHEARRQLKRLLAEHR